MVATYCIHNSNKGMKRDSVAIVAQPLIIFVSRISEKDIGHAVAQAVCRRLPNAPVRSRAQVKTYGICGATLSSGTGAGFLRVLQFPLPLMNSTNIVHSHVLSVVAW
jgi:hypothetical protein